MWDLNTGQTTRTYPTHGAQISSVSLQPYNSSLASPSASQSKGTGLDISVRVGEDFFDAKEELPPSSPPASSTPKAAPEAEDKIAVNSSPNGVEYGDANGMDVDTAAGAAEESSPHDSLFDDDADGEDVPPSDAVTVAASSPPIAPSRTAPVLALPAIKTTSATPTLRSIPVPSSAISSSAPFGIPSQSRNKFNSASSSSAGPSRLGGTASAPASGIPLLTPTAYKSFSDSVLMYSSMDGQVTLVDRRAGNGSGAVGRLVGSEKAPPWCMSVGLLSLIKWRYLLYIVNDVLSMVHADHHLGLLVFKWQSNPCGPTKRYD